METIIFSTGSVPVRVAARVYGKDASWVSEAAVKMAELKRKMELVEQTCIEADSDLYNYILQGVTKGYGYTYLQTVLGIPCTKDAYYDKYHKFFYILSNR